MKTIFTLCCLLAAAISFSQTGNVGIGTSSPESLLHLRNANTDVNASQLILEANSGYGNATYSALEFRANVASAGNSATGRIKSYATAPLYTSSAITFQIIAGGPSFVDALTLTDGRTGIGTTSPGTTLDVNGYTKLGSNAPAIKTLELSGTLPTTNQRQAFIPHGLTDTKILSITAMMNSGADQYPPNFQFNSALYGVYIYNGQVVMQTGSAASSSNAYGKTIRIFITYKE